MENNNYQTVNEQPQDIRTKTEYFFSQALAATIMSIFPVVSIVALFKGKSLLPRIVDFITACTQQGISIPGKLRAAKVLATVGKFAGLGFTIYWAACLIYLVVFMLFKSLLAIAMVGSGF